MAVQEISVYITEDASGTPQIHVDQEWAGVHSGSPVMWDFHSVAKKVTWAQIEFKDGSHFFRTRPAGGANMRYTELHGGHGEILGAAPELRGPSAPPTSKNSGYWIRVFSDKPGVYPPTKLEQELDPNIIVCDP